jgi:CDP-glucose 4,6-dehydratase
MGVSASFWQGKRVLVTGHTGFKGGWLSIWLRMLGAEVVGYALAPTSTPSLYHVASVADQLSSNINDVMDAAQLTRAMQQAAPEVVFHLAAQPLVRSSYMDPVGTFATNVMAQCIY